MIIIILNINDSKNLNYLKIFIEILHKKIQVLKMFSYEFLHDDKRMRNKFENAQVNPLCMHFIILTLFITALCTMHKFYFGASENST